MSTDNHTNRREFLRSLGRIAVAGLLIGGVGALTGRPDPDCVNQGVCQSCPALGRCALPAARSARTALPDE